MFHRRDRGRARLTALLACLGFCAPAAALDLELIALRGGSNAGSIPQDFDYQEIALRWRLPWQDDWGAWRADAHLEATAGRLTAYRDNAGLYTVGPSLGLRRGSIQLDLGIAPGYLSEDLMNGRRFGGGFQFTSHIGLYLVQPGWAIGYRLQHTSNAGYYTANDGLDLQALDVWLYF